MHMRLLLQFRNGSVVLPPQLLEAVKAPESAIQFIRCLIVPDPRSRSGAAQVTLHPWISVKQPSPEPKVDWWQGYGVYLGDDLPRLPELDMGSLAQGVRQQIVPHSLEYLPASHLDHSRNSPQDRAVFGSQRPSQQGGVECGPLTRTAGPQGGPGYPVSRLLLGVHR